MYTYVWQSIEYRNVGAFNTGWLENCIPFYRSCRPNLFSGNLCFLVVFVDVLMTKSCWCVNIFQISWGNLFDYERRLWKRFLNTKKKRNNERERKPEY